jgi:acetyl-CoA carboxylase biotin carboxylase subunit
MPCPGQITAFHPPTGLGIRLDTAAYTECVISPFYDSLIAKVISYGNNRGEAIKRMERALEMMIVEGVKTTIPLHQRVLANSDFREGKLHTHFLDRFYPR